ncbi:hypothetical protein [Mycolicibacterium fortuitum]|uniref:DUF7937 domain-containing protein n=1 Tax=Mycolicibacterium fortuitum TaxID=1766 RepID=UPI003AAD1D9C
MSNLDNSRQGDAAVLAASEDAYRRPNAIRDAGAAVLLVLGLLLPWNVYFGLGVTGTAGWVFGVLVVATLLAVAAAAAGRIAHSPDKLRLLLAAPYLVVVAGFVGFTVVQSIRFGGSGSVPPGIGPGVWFGAAGAVLASQPVIATRDGDDERYGAGISRIIGLFSLVLAVAAVLFNLYWRSRFVLPNIADAATGTQNLAVVIGAVLYGAVALLPVVLVARWMFSADQTARVATVVLAASVLIAGVFVWAVPVGRELDAFHGIAQNTSTAGVGFEGYLAWVLVAAVIGTTTVRSAQPAVNWRGVTRKLLLLIAVWCAGSAVLRIFDLLSAALLDLPAPPYNSTALMAFDLVTAVLAMWLFINGAGPATPKQLVGLLFGVLFAMTVCRVILGVALVPRSQPLNPTDLNEVYGNTLTQQITSTFDVALCVGALALSAITLFVGSSKKSAPYAAPRTNPETVVPKDVSTERFAPAAAPVPASAAVPANVRIARPTAPAPTSTQDRVAELLAQSTQRFGAGTTYGGADSGQSGVKSGR